MSDDKEKTQRRVYVLPTELVERLVAYQEAMGLQSEVEAARRLLDEALKHRDDWLAITRRFQEKLKETRMMSDIAKDVLMGHPLVNNIGIGAGSISFALTTGESVTIFSDGDARAKDRRGTEILLDKNGKDSDELPF